MTERRGVPSAWSGDGPTVDDDVIDTAERRIGARFPRELRAFYLDHNGGWPEDDEDDDHRHPSVHGYTPIGEPDDDTCLVGLAALLVEQDERLAGRIPFAYDAGGNIFLSPEQGTAEPVPLIWLPQTCDLESCTGLTLSDLLPSASDRP